MRQVLVFAMPVLACLVALCVTACDERSSSSPSSQPAREVGPRIVSLSPAISRSLVDLDLAKFIVGRTPYCTALDESIPIVGDLLTIDYEQLIRLNPTHILVQPPAAGVDPHLAALAENKGWSIGAWRLDGIDDIRALVSGLAGMICPALQADECDTLRIKASRIDEQINAALAASADASVFTGRVLMIGSANPVLAYGNGTYLDDILQALGGKNAVADDGWVQLSLEDIVRLAPDAIIRVRPGGSEAELTSELGPLATIDAPAVKASRLAMLNHIDAELPSSGVIGVAAQLRSILQRFAAGAPSADNRP